jgi:16S rRNA (cytidine1402-2'-O)-methyltransferase
MTKIHEEFLRGTASEILKQLEGRDGEVRGEITLLIGKATRPAPSSVPIEQAVESQIGNGMSRMDAMKLIARERGISKREVYKHLVEPVRGSRRGKS